MNCFENTHIKIFRMYLLLFMSAMPMHLLAFQKTEQTQKASVEIGSQSISPLNIVKAYAPEALKVLLTDSAPIKVVINHHILSFSYQSPGILIGKSGAVTAKIIYQYNRKYNALWYQLELKNDGKDSVNNVEVIPVDLRFRTNFEQTKPRIRYMSGGYHYDGVYPPRAYQLNERIFMTNDHAKPVTIKGNVQGSSIDYVPMLQFAIGESDNLSGFTVGFEWSGTWSITAGWEQPAFSGPLPSDFLVNGSMGFGKFLLKPGQNILFPKTHLIFFEGGSWNHLENAQRKYIAEDLGYKIRDKQNFNKVTYDHWFGIHGDFDINIMMQEAQKAADLGVEYFCLDAGWYGKGYFGSSNTGKWDEPDPVKFPNGVADIKKLSDFCKSHGMGFGMWHDIDARNGGGKPLNYADSGDRRIAIQTLRKWIKQWDLTWMRWEMTGAMETQVEEGLDYWLGYYAVMDTILKENPHLIIECCFGGSGRFDLGMVQRTASTWLSDQTADPDIDRYMQTGALRFWPSYLLNMAVRVHRHSGDREATAYNVISRMAGALSFNGDIAQWSDSSTKKIKAIVDKYKQIRHLQLQPIYFPLPQPQSSNDWDAVCFGDGKKEQQLLYLFRMDGKDEMYLEVPQKNTSWKLVMSSNPNVLIERFGNGYKIFLPPNTAAVWKR